MQPFSLSHRPQPAENWIVTLRNGSLSRSGFAPHFVVSASPPHLLVSSSLRLPVSLSPGLTSRHPSLRALARLSPGIRTPSAQCRRPARQDWQSPPGNGSRLIVPRGELLMTAESLQRTPLYDRHVALGARLVPFAGWEMPVQYEGVIPEHRAVRADAGVFDVSHMGEIDVEGPRAHELLQVLLSNDLGRLEDGHAQYTLLTNERGGIVDDLIVYRLSPFHY